MAAPWHNSRAQHALLRCEACVGRMERLRHPGIARAASDPRISRRAQSGLRPTRPNPGATHHLGGRLMPSDRTRRPRDPIQAAEAAFKAATTKPPEVIVPKSPSLPNAKELVSLRIDRDVLEHFQE